MRLATRDPGCARTSSDSRFARAPRGFGRRTTEPRKRRRPKRKRRRGGRARHAARAQDARATGTRRRRTYVKPDLEKRAAVFSDETKARLAHKETKRACFRGLPLRGLYKPRRVLPVSLGAAHWDTGPSSRCISGTFSPCTFLYPTRVWRRRPGRRRRSST